MDADLELVYRKVMDADRPEDVFGAENIVLPARTLLGFLEQSFQRMKRISTPENYSSPEDADAAEAANQKLEHFYAAAQASIREGLYGFPGYDTKRPAFATKSFTVGSRRYFIGQKLESDEALSSYQGFMEKDGLAVGEVVLKLANDASHNYLPEREARNLFLLHTPEVPQWKHLPFLIDSFRAGSRMGLVLRKNAGVSLTAVRRHPTHAAGVDPRHIAWLLDRYLSCLGYVHSQGIVHGALTPDNVWLEPANHNGLLTNWSVAVANPALSGELIEFDAPPFSAPEIHAHEAVGPWTDIFSLGKLMIWLLGGNPEANTLPDTVDQKFADFLKRLVIPSPHRRPSDAWKLYAEQCALKDSLWPRKFLHFDMS